MGMYIHLEFRNANGLVVMETELWGDHWMQAISDQFQQRGPHPDLNIGDGDTFNHTWLTRSEILLGNYSKCEDMEDSLDAFLNYFRVRFDRGATWVGICFEY